MSIDRREDAGDFYPGGKVISTRPVATGGDVKHSDFAGLGVKTNTIPDLREAVRELGRRLGATVVTALAVCVASAATVQTVPVNDLDFDANPSIVTNVVFDAPPDFSTNNAALVETIQTTTQPLSTNTYNLAANAGYYLAVRDLAVAFGASVTNDPYADPPAPTPPPSVRARRIAMFIIPVNAETNGVFCGLELKASTNNFSHADGVTEDVRLQYYAQSEIADTGLVGTNVWDRVRLYVCTSQGFGDKRSYTRILNTIDWPRPLTSVVALVDASCLARHPDGDWLRENNDDLSWCYLRNRAVSPPYELEAGTSQSLWRPIAPARWYASMPAWATGD